MFLAGLFLPVGALPKPAQCSGSVTMDTKHRALTLTWAVLSGSCCNCPVWDPDLLLPGSSRTSLSLTSSFVAGQNYLVMVPCSLIPLPAKSPFSIWIWWWSQWPNSIFHAKVLSCSGWDPGLGWEPQMLLMQQGSLRGGHCSDPELPSSRQPCHPTLCLYQHWRCRGGDCRVRWKDSVHPLQNSSNVRLKAVLFLLAPFI